MKITIFSEELRECLNAAGMSDCGENDTWNYWYQRLMNAYNESVERQIMTEQTENAKLRELVSWMYDRMDESCAVQHPYVPAPISYDLLMQALARARELGVEVDG